MNSCIPLITSVQHSPYHENFEMAFHYTINHSFYTAYYVV